MEKRMSRHTALLVALIGATAALAGSDAQAQARVEVGVLTCTVRGGAGFIVGSTKELRCRFNKPGRDEFYHGTINKFGIDIGITKQSAMPGPCSRRPRTCAPGHSTAATVASAPRRPWASASAQMR
jgi:hypothetical protein